MNWFDGLQAFLAVAEEKSFSKAARLYDLPSSVITKRIQWLEAQLETTLFIRTTRKVDLTEAGEYIEKRAAPILEAWADLHQEFLDFEQQPSGLLTIGFAPNLVELPLFIECLSSFSELFPSIQLKVVTVKPNTQLVDEKIDVLIGIDKYVGDPEKTKQIRLFSFHYGCYTSKAYLRKINQSVTLENLKDLQCLSYRDNVEWEIDNQGYLVNGTYSFDSGDSILAACLSGMGIIYYPTFMLEQKKITQPLIPLLEDHTMRQQTLFLYYTDTTYRARKTSLFIDHAKEYLMSE